MSLSIVCIADFAELSISSRYLCVQNGRRVKPEDFYPDLVRRNREAFGCAWGASELRQGMITLGREFISPNETFPCADDVLAEAADHSTEVDVAHYAAVHGALPRLSNNALSQHRWLCEEWGSLLGMGPHPPPEPVRVIRTKARSAKPLDAGELALQVSGLVADVVMARLAEIGLTPDLVMKLGAAAERQPEAYPRAALNPSSPCVLAAVSLAGAIQEPRLPEPLPEAGHSRIASDSWWDDDGVLDLTTSPAPLLSTKARPTPPARLAEDDELYYPPSSGSLLANPFEFLARPGRATPPRVKRQNAATVLVPATRRAKSSPHAFDTFPTGTPMSPIRFPGSRRHAPPFSQFMTWPSSPSKRLRRGDQRCDDIEDKSEEEEEEEPADQPENSMDDFVVHDTSQSSSSSFDTEGGTLTRNVNHQRIWGAPEARDNIRGAIQDLVGDRKAREKSYAQMLGILLVMRGQHDAMITMPTGGGKSMLWLVPVLLDTKAKFMVVCPFTVLLDQQCDNAQNAGVKAINFSQTDAIPEDVQILFLQVEHITGKKLAE